MWFRKKKNSPANTPHALKDLAQKSGSKNQETLEAQESVSPLGQCWYMTFSAVGVEMKSIEKNSAYKRFLERLEGIAEEAQSEGNYSIALKAMELLGKASGFFFKLQDKPSSENLVLETLEQELLEDLIRKLEQEKGSHHPLEESKQRVPHVADTQALSCEP